MYTRGRPVDWPGPSAAAAISPCRRRLAGAWRGEHQHEPPLRATIPYRAVASSGNRRATSAPAAPAALASQIWLDN